MRPSLADVLEALVHMDSNGLIKVEETVAVRRRQLGQVQAGSYRIGDVVRMNHRIRPAYLRGLTATIIGINRTTVSVRCPVDARYGRFSGCRSA